MADNSNIRDKAKLIWIKGMKAIGNTATNIANNTKFKVDEMTLQNRRRELSGDLSNAVYAMWLKGTEFPSELTRLLEELQLLDNKLNDMRAEKYAQGQVAQKQTEDSEDDRAASEKKDDTAVTEDETEEEPEEESEEETELSEAVTGASASVRSEIDGCFDHDTTVEMMARKVNTSLDHLTDKIRSFPPESSEEGK